MEELGQKQDKIHVYHDNQGALYIAKNSTFYSRTKHIDVQYQFFRDVVEEEIVDMKKIHAKENLSDVITKPIYVDNFN